jgi:uncharacterized protein with ATP-grasp and redox domains
MSRPRGHGQKRDRLEDAALAALLSEPTIGLAAAKTGVSESTVRRWLQDAEFQARYRTARRQVVEVAVSGLQQATSEAVDALRRNLTCGVPAAEIAAAKAVIDFAIKGVELTDLAERVEQLERTSELLGKGAA